jgi:uncharacterized protein
MKVFVDTSAWIARQVNSDVYNKSSIKSYQRYKQNRALFFTNSFVLSETYTRLIYDYGLKVASRFHEIVNEALELRELSIFEIDDEEREIAWIYLEKYQDHELSFTDATIVANFSEFKLNEIFTFDHHFKEINLPTNL